ncbi:MAG: tripartite tricarboxylate transporter substrate binding protein [Betaproteobacteria bacterium]|nr:tripartite tricarboxylate transporter substrate binding protein [Betaproteobacteria bacterium]
MFTLRLFMVLGLATLALSSGSASSQSYPAKPVRVVIPWPAGGSNDIVGRTVMQKVSESLGQQFVIDNRPGASGTIGADLVAKSPGDGYTLMVQSTTHLGNATMYRKLPYDTLRDFVPVALLCQQPGGLIVHPSLPVKSVKEFIALAKASPGQILYSSSGNGSAPHLSMAQFIGLTGIKLVHVPYKGGPPAVTAIVSGETQAMTATLATVLPQIKAGRLRLVATTSAQRLTLMPEVPTIAETGVPGYEMSPWIAVFASGGTPNPIIDKLNGEIARALRLPDVHKSLAGQALEPWIATPEEFAVRVKADYEKYARLIKASGARIE